MKKIAIVYLVHDGFTSLYTGVGTVARDFLLSFPDVCKKLSKNYDNLRLELFASTIKYDKTCFGYSEEIKKVTKTYVQKYKNIHLVELINGSAGKKSYGSIDLWHNACISAATFVYTLINTTSYDKVIVICVDTPFTQVANYFFDQYTHKNVEFIWLPQSTVLVHKYDSGLRKPIKQSHYIEERYTWEKKIIDLAKKNHQVKIGFVGKFMKRHLMQEYEAIEGTLVSLKNGLFFPRLKGNIISQRKIASILSSFDVPLNRPLLFSFGRAEPYKGLDLIIKNSEDLIKQLGYYVLLIASPYSMDDPYITELNELSSKFTRDNIRIIYDLDFLTPHYIMQWKNTKILALLSRAEPSGLIPIESRFYKNKNLSLIVSDIGGFRDQVTEGIDGFKTKLNDQSICSKLKEVAKLPTEKKAIMAERGYSRIVRDYDQTKINATFIKQFI